MLNWLYTKIKSIGYWIPGLPELITYNIAFLRHDITAGLSVAAVALPTSLAYAQLAGLPPQAGLYSTILPMMVYTFFGSSRQLIVGPDAATCAMLASTLAPIASATLQPEYYQSLALTLTLLTGILFIIAASLKMGFLADLQSRPILIGLMNGVAVMIIIGQLGNITGIPVTSGNTIGKLQIFIQSIHEFHWITTLLAATLFALFYGLQYKHKRIPAILIVAIIAVIASIVFSLESNGVQTVGTIPSALPGLHLPTLPYDQLGSLFLGALALVFVSFMSASLTAHTFAAKNNYEVDDNQELFALGAANISSALCHGFAISGADSRTAVNEAAGSKTRVAQLFAALTILVALVVLIKPIGYMPLAALGVILVCSAIKLTNFSALMQLRKFSKTEFSIALLTFVFVLFTGVIYAVLFATLLSILSFLRKTARPTDHCLGLVPEQDRFYELDTHPDAKEVPGLLLYRFAASLIFLNANYFRQRILTLINRPDIEPVRWVIIDGSTINNIDLTATMMLSDLGKTLSKRGIVVAFIDQTNHLQKWLKTHEIPQSEVSIRLYASRYEVLAAYREAMNNTNTSEKTSQHQR